MQRSERCSTGGRLSYMGLIGLSGSRSSFCRKTWKGSGASWEPQCFAFVQSALKYHYFQVRFAHGLNGERMYSRVDPSSRSDEGHTTIGWLHTTNMLSLVCSDSVFLRAHSVWFLRPRCSVQSVRRKFDIQILTNRCCSRSTCFGEKETPLV